MPNLRRSDRVAGSSLRLTGPSSSLPQIYTAKKLTQSLIYKPNQSREANTNPQNQEANTISNLQTNLIVVASFRTTHWSRRCQTHSPPSDPPTNLWSFTYLFLSIYHSISLSHDQCLFLRKTEFFFFFFCWFGLYIQISYYNIKVEGLCSLVFLLKMNINLVVVVVVVLFFVFFIWWVL